jgi:hypothetical protein
LARTELGKDEGNRQFSTMADARMDYKAPIEPKDVDAIVHYLISIGGANQAGGRRLALVVKHQRTTHRRRAA